MKSWVAIAYAALDLRYLSQRQTDAELMLVAVKPSEPIGLAGEYAALWMRLVEEGPIADESLSEIEQVLIREYEAAGIVSTDSKHSDRIEQVQTPWLLSPLHECVYALIARIAREIEVRVVFIKGPMLHRQGLRDREHSGDVDVWVDPNRIGLLAEALGSWGWRYDAGLWGEALSYHSMTLVPEAWGCEIDLHRHMPGCAVSDEEGFERLASSSETVQFAGTSVLVPSLGAHAVVAALHSWRPQYGREAAPHHRDEAIRVLRKGGEDSLRFADIIRATAALAPVFQETSAGMELRVDYEPPLNWLWRAEKHPIKRYILALKLVPFSQKLSVLRRVIWPVDSAAIVAERMSGGTSKNATRAKLNRLKRGLVSLIKRNP